MSQLNQCALALVQAIAAHRGRDLNTQQQEMSAALISKLSHKTSPCDAI